MKRYLRTLNELLEELEDEQALSRDTKFLKNAVGGHTKKQKREMVVSRALGCLELLLQDLRELDRLDS